MTMLSVATRLKLLFRAARCVPVHIQAAHDPRSLASATVGADLH